MPAGQSAHSYDMFESIRIELERKTINILLFAHQIYRLQLKQKYLKLFRESWNTVKYEKQRDL